MLMDSQNTTLRISMKHYAQYVLQQKWQFSTTNLQKGKILHMDFALYNVTSILVITSMPPLVCEKK